MEEDIKKWIRKKKNSLYKSDKEEKFDFAKTEYGEEKFKEPIGKQEEKPIQSFEKIKIQPEQEFETPKIMEIDKKEPQISRASTIKSTLEKLKPPNMEKSDKLLTNKSKVLLFLNVIIIVFIIIWLYFFFK